MSVTRFEPFRDPYGSSTGSCPWPQPGAAAGVHRQVIPAVGVPGRLQDGDHPGALAQRPDLPGWTRQSLERLLVSGKRCRWPAYPASSSAFSSSQSSVLGRLFRCALRSSARTLLLRMAVLKDPGGPCIRSARSSPGSPGLIAALLGRRAESLRERAAIDPHCRSRCPTAASAVPRRTSRAPRASAPHRPRCSAMSPLTLRKIRSMTSAPSCRTGRNSCRYTVSVTWLLAWPESRAIFSIAMPSSDSSETNVCRKSRGAQSLPNLALSQTSWNIFRMCLAPSGVPVAVVNTPPVSCQCDPAASRSAAWSTCHSLSAPTAICASFSTRRDLGVFVSPPARSARSTATDAGLPSRSTSCSHPIARAFSGRMPAIRLTTM